MSNDRQTIRPLDPPPQIVPPDANLQAIHDLACRVSDAIDMADIIRAAYHEGFSDAQDRRMRRSGVSDCWPRSSAWDRMADQKRRALDAIAKIEKRANPPVELKPKRGTTPPDMRMPT